MVPFNMEFDLDKIDVAQSTKFLAGLQELEVYEIWLRILKNNIFVLVFNLLGGFSFGLLTFFNTIYNGFVLGYLIKTLKSVHSNGFIINHLYPHAIEVVAIVLSCYLGYKIGTYIFGYIFKCQKITVDRTDYLIAFFSFSIIFISSILEAYVSIN